MVLQLFFHHFLLIFHHILTFKRRPMYIVVSRSVHTHYIQVTYHCVVQKHRLNNCRRVNPWVGFTDRTRGPGEKRNRPAT